MNENYSNFSEFFEYITGLFGNNPAIFWKEKGTNGTGSNSAQTGSYTSLSGKKLKELVYHLSHSLSGFGLKPGDKAAIISESRFEWVISDFACVSNRLVSVPVYPTMTSQQIKYILEHSESKICFVSTKLMYEKVNAVFSELPHLKKIIIYNKLLNEAEHTVNFEDLIYVEIIHGKVPYDEKKADEYFEECSKKTDPEELFTIIYTSGTTGNPKGVCLSHRNVLANIKQCTDSFPVDSTDRFLSFLPLAHTYERTGGYYVPLSKGAQIYYAENIDRLAVNMTEARPTIVLAVPMLFTRIYSRVMKNIESLSGLKRFITKRALKTGMKYRTNKENILWRVADKKVFRAIREKTGGSIKFFISGGSALNKDIAEFFDSVGILILQGYGMTEASPVISVSRVDRNKFGSVGPPLEGVNVKIAADGEILVQGDNVMKGYYHNDKETHEMIADGWLHTGDIGVIDKDGFLAITDRKKTLIKTSIGKYISLTHIEDTLQRSDLIDRVITFASDDKDFVSALVVPDLDKLRETADKLKLNDLSLNELISNEEIIRTFDLEIKQFQKPLAKHERVRKFALLERPFTIEGGELTPTLKLKRKVIEEKYKDIIEGFYIS
ncbi:MAG: long-chain fatty acid--CoA ligase [Ignavibacteria bacterium]|nr:long-chain fatty acid--CoA ligase [Ignavibacteria bacterium]